MNVSERKNGSVTILDVNGNITLGDSADALRDKVRASLSSGTKQIVMNLSDVSYMDSAGLGELVSAHATAARQGASLKLANATTRLQDLLVITKLSTVFDMYDDETAAISSFNTTA